MTDTEIGEWLKQAAADRGWSYADFAREATRYMPAGKNITAASVSSYVRGLLTPGNERLDALRKAVEGSPDATDLREFFTVNTPLADACVYEPRRPLHAHGEQPRGRFSVLVRTEAIPKSVKENLYGMGGATSVNCWAYERPVVYEKNKKYSEMTALFTEADTRNVSRDSLLRRVSGVIEVAVVKHSHLYGDYNALMLCSVTVDVNDLRNALEEFAG